MIDLEALKNVDIERVNRSDLIDIETVSVGKHIKDEDRIAEFIRQLRNPYCFISGKYVIKARYTDNGPTIEECVRGIIV